MVRALFSDPKPSSKTSEENRGTGIGYAIRACVRDTEYILAGKCDVVDYILRDFADFERAVFGISLLRALMRTIVYILNVFVAIDVFNQVISGV